MNFKLVLTVIPNQLYVYTVTVVTEHVVILVASSGNDDGNGDMMVELVWWQYSNDPIRAHPDYMVRKGFRIIEALENARNKSSGVVPSLTTMTLCFIYCLHYDSTTQLQHVDYSTQSGLLAVLEICPSADPATARTPIQRSWDLWPFTEGWEAARLFFPFSSLEAKEKWKVKQK